MRRAFVFVARQPAVRLAAALATQFGFPRTPLESEITRIGGGIHVPLEQLVWSWWARIRAISTGPLAGRYVVVLETDKPAIAALDGVSMPVPAAHGNGVTSFAAASGAVITSDHEGPEEDP